tara:strand:+ start:293 stop:589 length:297 start_codon:yes stop_codon:yes gene_type:complete
MKTQYKYEFYFGTDIENTSVVTDEMFDNFLAKNVRPHFKGFSILTLNGEWNGIKETTKVLIIIDSELTETIVNKIRDTYKNTFKQESVFVTKHSINII